jgi:hypothetical protein
MSEPKKRGGGGGAFELPPSFIAALLYISPGGGYI